MYDDVFFYMAFTSFQTKVQRNTTQRREAKSLFANSDTVVFRDSRKRNTVHASRIVVPVLPQHQGQPLLCRQFLKFCTLDLPSSKGLGIIGDRP